MFVVAGAPRFKQCISGTPVQLTILTEFRPEQFLMARRSLPAVASRARTPPIIFLRSIVNRNLRPHDCRAPSVCATEEAQDAARQSR
jgi:hypothetical protein